RDWLDVARHPGALQRLVVAMDHALHVPLSDRRRVRVHRVQQNLYRRRAAATEIPGEVVRDHHAGVHPPLADRISELAGRRVVGAETKAPAFGEYGDQLTAFGDPTLVDDTQAQVGHRGAQRVAEQGQLHERGNDQRDHEAAIAPDLVELLGHQRADARAE